MMRHSEDEAPLWYEKQEESVQGTSTTAALTTSGLFNQYVPSGMSKTEITSDLLYKFFNSANIAIRQASNTYLHDLLKHLVENASHYQKNMKQLSFSKSKYKYQQNKSFYRFVHFVKSAVSATRAYYTERVGVSVPFITVAHDGWDSKKNDVLGVSIHFVVPHNMIRLEMPVGLQKLGAKTSVEVANQIMKILSR
jgi:hypothetical protein